jgi:hypothetical protein
MTDTLVLPVLWSSLGLVVLASSLLAARHRAALRVGLLAVAVLFIAAGAVVNLVMLVWGETYADFAETSYLVFVRETWAALVVPNRWVFISLLVVFEATVGVLVLLGGRWTRLGLIAAVAFHVALLAFGWGFWLWSVPMVLALLLLLRAHGRVEGGTGVPPQPGVTT